MSSSTGPIYEVTLTIDHDIVEPFDEWLAFHVDEILALPGFVKATVFSLHDDDEGHARRVTQYHLESQDYLDNYLAGPAGEMRQSGIDRFGDRFSASRRVLNKTEIADARVTPVQHCLNCGAILGGQYCGVCGQRARSRLISLWELMREAFGDLFELDSRIWRTLMPLLMRPGKLTREYLEGRRASFMPPFRTYLVLSIVFFLVLLFDPKEEFGILFEPESDVATQTATDEQRNEIRDEILSELAEEGIIAAPQPAPANSGSEAEEAVEEEESSDHSIIVRSDDSEVDCDLDSMDEITLPDWLARRMTRERLQVICEKVSADDGKALLTKLQDNVPAALFFLLPLMAFVLKLMYPLSKRYYVEHLLFVVHYHAFFFLILILQILSVRFAEMIRVPETLIDVAVFSTSLYIPVYLYKAMRRVYDQGRLATIPKFLFLLASYFAGLLIIFGVAAILAAFAI